MLHNILRGVGICVTRRYKGGGGVKNDPKKRYIIFEWPLNLFMIKILKPTKYFIVKCPQLTGMRNNTKMCNLIKMQNKISKKV